MDQTPTQDIGMATIIVASSLIAIPAIYWWWMLYMSRPKLGVSMEEDAKSKHWKGLLWFCAFLFYAIFAVSATRYLEIEATYGRIALAVLVYLLPLFYIGPSIRTYNLTNHGLLLFLGIDECELTRGIWFIPIFLSKTIMFTTALRERQFPQDSLGEEHDKTISLSTGEHLITEVDKTDNTTKTSFKKPEEMGEEDVLSKIIMLNVSVMVVFRYVDARKLFKNFSDIFMSDGELGVTEEISRQVRDYIVATATELFPNYTAREIFVQLNDINSIIFEKINKIIENWGIELVTARLMNLNYDKKISEFLDDVVKKNTEAIGHYIETQKETKAYELWTKVKSERAKLLNAPDGDKLALILQLEAAADIAKGSTNYNIGGTGMALVDMLSKISKTIGT